MVAIGFAFPVETPPRIRRPIAATRILAKTIGVTA